MRAAMRFQGARRVSQNSPKKFKRYVEAGEIKNSEMANKAEEEFGEQLAAFEKQEARNKREHELRSKEAGKAPDPNDRGDSHEEASKIWSQMATMAKAGDDSEADYAHRIILARDDAFLSSITRVLKSAETAIRDRNAYLGLDNNLRMTPEAEQELKKTYQKLDVDNTGELDWRVLRAQMQKDLRSDDLASHAMLHSIIGTLASTTGEAEGFTVSEDEFVDRLGRKACGQLGASGSEQEAVHRQLSLLNKLLLFDGETDDSKLDAEFEQKLREKNHLPMANSQDENEDFQGAAGCHIPCFPAYLAFSSTCKRIAYSTLFSLLIMLCIIGIGVMEAMDTYRQAHDVVPPVMQFFDDLFLFTFAAEMMLKIAAEGQKPWAYWTGPAAAVSTVEEMEAGKAASDGADDDDDNGLMGNSDSQEGMWNCFDSFIVVTSFLGNYAQKHMPALDLNFTRMIRLVRLVRFIKILRFLPEMRTVLGGTYPPPPRLICPTPVYVNLLTFSNSPPSPLPQGFRMARSLCSLFS
jgi:Ca2+-binding EF-hand superfamily protein